MKKQILTREVTVTGPNIWGFNSSITFEPSENDGWYLRTKNEGDVPIDFRITESRKNKLAFVAGGTTLEVIEHIMALKILTGLDKVILIPHNKWPPYLGGARGYYNQLYPAMFQTDEHFKTIKPERDALEISKKMVNGVSVYVRIKASSKIQFGVNSCWKPLPSRARFVTEENLKSEKFVEEIINARPQGISKIMQLLANIASFFWWPNMEHIAWKNEGYPDSISKEFNDHALQDGLGEIALCHHKYIPVMEYFRNYAGHKESLACIKKAFS